MLNILKQKLKIFKLSFTYALNILKLYMCSFITYIFLSITVVLTYLRKICILLIQ